MEGFGETSTRMTNHSGARQGIFFFLKRLLDFKPGCGSLKPKHLSIRAPLDYHQLNTCCHQQCCNTLHRCTHLHGILNITVHQPPGYKIEMSLTYNKNTHAHSDKTSTRIIATISKNKHNMYYSHVKKFKIMLS